MRGVRSGYCFSGRARDKREIRLPQKIAAEEHDEIAGGLDVHRTADHVDQLLTQRDEVRRDSRILVIAQRP